MKDWEGLVARFNLKPQEACRRNTAIHARTRSITNCHHPDELSKAHLIQQRLEKHTVECFSIKHTRGARVSESPCHRMQVLQRMTDHTVSTIGLWSYRDATMLFHHHPCRVLHHERPASSLPLPCTSPPPISHTTATSRPPNMPLWHDEPVGDLVEGEDSHYLLRPALLRPLMRNVTEWRVF